MKYDNTIKCIALTSIIMYILYVEYTKISVAEPFSTDKPYRASTKYPCDGRQKCSPNSGWPTCYVNPSLAPEGYSISTDPCLTFPEGDLPDMNSQKPYPVSGKNAYFKSPHMFKAPKDNLGNAVQNPTNWFTGRGLAQLTWSCNYMKTQRIIYFLNKGLHNAQHQIANDWNVMSSALNLSLGSSAIHTIEQDIKKINICRNPDSVCGNYTIQVGTPTINYSSSIVDQAIPWLTYIIYWCEIVNTNPSWGKNFDFKTALAGISHVGNNNASKRLAFATLYAYMLGLTDSDFSIQKNTRRNSGIENICLQSTNTLGCSEPGAGEKDFSCVGYKRTANNVKCQDCESVKCTQKDPTGVCGKCARDIACTDSKGRSSDAMGTPHMCSTHGTTQDNESHSSKSALAYDISPLDSFRFIMQMKDPNKKPSDCIHNNGGNSYISTKMSEQQKQDICAGESQKKLKEWENKEFPKNNLGNTNSIFLTYPINCRMKQPGYNESPLYSVGKPFSVIAREQQINPMYTWEGLAFAVYLWNLGSQHNDILRRLGGFCSSKNIVENKLTLAIFLGNATVESANFMICNESTIATGGSDNSPTSCDVYSKQSGFPGRYFKKCKNTQPCKYGCCTADQHECSEGYMHNDNSSSGLLPISPGKESLSPISPSGKFTQCKPTPDGIEEHGGESKATVYCSYRSKEMCNNASSNGKQLCNWNNI